MGVPKAAIPQDSLVPVRMMTSLTQHRGTPTSVNSLTQSTLAPPLTVRTSAVRAELHVIGQEVEKSTSRTSGEGS